MKKVLFSALLLSLALASGAKVRLPALVGDGMVLQQKTKANVWGWADKGKTVTVTTSWDKASYTAKPDDQGRWMVKVATPGAGGAYTMTISDGEPVTVSDILIGEVWICSGQSNMAMLLRGSTGQPVDNSLQTIMDAGKYSKLIHSFTLPRRESAVPEEDCTGTWVAASPNTAWNIGAVPYFFAMHLTNILGVPVGVINNSWGGSSIESWLDEATARTVPGLNVEAHKPAEGRGPHATLSYLHNGMTWPVRNYTAKGFLWYQGESNRTRYATYAEAEAAMVKKWRELWGDENMPFYCVEIAPYYYNNADGTEAARLREAQFKALSLIPNSGMAATADAGSMLCIHPPQKDVVATRLATLALVKTYGMAKAFPATGPVYSSVSFEGGKATVKFTETHAGMSPGFAPVKGFEIAGADRKFYPAEAKIVQPDKVEVSSPEVAKPVAVRYAFRNYIEANLSNTFMQAAFPFRTDDWAE